MSFSPAPYSPGYNFGGAAARRMESKLASIAADNARRVQCPHCGLAILPENMTRHLGVVHDAEVA